MKIKLEDLRKALDHLRYHGGCKDDAIVELSFRTEDIAANRLCDCVIISTSGEREPSSYSTFQSSITQVSTLEVFAENENRPIRWTTQETQDLVPKAKS
jgi:hypothetical protein